MLSLSLFCYSYLKKLLLVMSFIDELILHFHCLFVILMLTYLLYSSVIVVVVVLLSFIEPWAICGCGIGSFVKGMLWHMGTCGKIYYIVLLCFLVHVGLFREFVGVFARKLSVLLLLVIFAHAT